MKSPIDQLESKIWDVCVFQRPAPDKETADIWQTDEVRYLNEGFIVKEIPQEMIPLAESALNHWKEIEETLCTRLNTTPEQFLNDFRKIREDYLNQQADFAKLTLTMLNAVYGVVRNLDWVNLFSWILPRADAKNAEKHLRAGLMMSAVFYIELLSKPFAKYAAQPLKKIEARWLIANQLLFQITSYKPDNSIHDVHSPESRFSYAEREAQIKFKKSVEISPAAQANGEFLVCKTYRVPYCLPRQHKKENIFSEIRDEAYLFFRNHNIKWHSTGENHLLSSQAYCVNFFFPFARNKEALKSLLLPLYPEIEEMLSVEDGMYVTFEWNGGKNYLNEQSYNSERGANATYVDAAVRFKRKDGKIQDVLIEWKYTEKYAPKDLGENDRGQQRVKTYLPFCEAMDCPVQLTSVDTDIETGLRAFFYNPFYQLLRQQLLAHEIEKEDNGIDAVSVLHICSEKNDAFRTMVTSPKIQETFPGKGVIEIWKSLVKNPSKFESTSPEKLFQGFPRDMFPDYTKWADYMKLRYRV